MGHRKSVMLDVVMHDVGTWDDADAARYEAARGTLITLIAECTARLAGEPGSTDLRRIRQAAEDRLIRLDPEDGPGLDAAIRDAKMRLAELRRAS